MDFENILKELEFRVPNGIIDLTNDSQVIILSELLRQNGDTDAFETAQKARVYFTYLTETISPLKEIDSSPFSKMVTYTPKGGGAPRKIKVSSGLSYDTKHPGYMAAVSSLKADKVSPKKINAAINKSKVKSNNTVKGTAIFGDKNKKTSSIEDDKTKQYKPTETQEKIFKGRKKVLLEVIEKGFLSGVGKITSGVGAFEPSDDDVADLVDITKKQLKDPSYRRKLPKYDVSDNDMDIALGIVKNKLGDKPYKKWVNQVTKSGAVDTFLTTGENGKKRFRAIVKKYLQTGGRSAITGKFVPFNHMQLDHHIPFSSAAAAVKDKKQKGIKTTLETEKTKLDSPENWDLMETPINQFKNCLTGEALISKGVKKLSMSPDEKELKKINDQIKTMVRDQLYKNLSDAFSKGDYSGFTAKSIGDLNMEEQQIVAKAWNYYHPNLSQRDTKNFLEKDPDYPKKLKKLGIDINKPNPHFIVRYKAQVGGSRTRSLPKKPELMRKDMIASMKAAGVISTNRDSINTDTALAKAIQKAEKEQEKLKQRKKELGDKIRQAKKKKS